jgi:hypothetical protein
MADYYKNSYITLSALESTGAYEGLFPAQSIGDVVELPKHPGMWVRRRLMEHSRMFRQAPLNGRGWTFQERLLSTRILHFTKEGMFWECQTLALQESSTKQHMDAADLGELIISEGEDFKRLMFSIQNHSIPRSEVLRLWRHLARQFSRRTLRFSSDRLPAIAGLASVFAEKLRSRYLAGIWEEDLAEGLAWSRDDVRNRILHADADQLPKGNIRYPSWSWASSNESVKYNIDTGLELETSYERSPTLVANYLEVEGANPFGSPVGGYIVVRALAIDRKVNPYTIEHEVPRRSIHLLQRGNYVVELVLAWDEANSAWGRIFLDTVPVLAYDDALWEETKLV